MGTYRRINVSSGRQLEQTAHYSRALRVGDRVFQAGTTAIDRDGHVVGEGDVTQQIDAIMRIVQWSMDKVESPLDDVVRGRIYLTDISLADQAGRALARYFRDVRPVYTMVEVSALARPTGSSRCVSSAVGPSNFSKASMARSASVQIACAFPGREVSA